MSAKTWKRPQSHTDGQVWDTFQGKPLPTGQIPRFRIQYITQELIEPVIKHMQVNYLRDEPFARFLNGANDEQLKEEIGKFWRWALSYNIGLVCILDNPEELPKDFPVIAGVNITYPTFRDTAITDVTYPPLAAYVKITVDTVKLLDCFETYNVDIVLSSFGLSVDPCYRGHKIGERFFGLRPTLSRALGIKVTSVVFSSRYSKVIGRKLGYTVVGRIRSADFMMGGKAIFAEGIHTGAEDMELHVLKFEE